MATVDVFEDVSNVLWTRVAALAEGHTHVQRCAKSLRINESPAIRRWTPAPPGACAMGLN
jgi:hypothetical protein